MIINILTEKGKKFITVKTVRSYSVFLHQQLWGRQKGVKSTTWPHINRGACHQPQNEAGNQPRGGGGMPKTGREMNRKAGYQPHGGKVTKIAAGYHQVYLSLSPSLKIVAAYLPSSLLFHF